MRRGERAERFFYETLKEILPGLKPTTNSGAKFGNGDMATADLLIDVKSTEGTGFSKIAGEDWKKIAKQAAGLGKDFIVPILNEEGEAGIIFPLDLGIAALKLLYEVPDEENNVESDKRGTEDS